MADAEPFAAPATAVDATVDAPDVTADAPDTGIFRSLNFFNARLYFASLLLSTIGSWLQLTATSYLVYRLTGKASDLGYNVAFQFLPMLFLGTWAGSFADRYDRRRTLLISQCVQMSTALTLAILTVPVVIVATEEALAAVPRSMREGSLACGASKWQTITRIVLPRAMPGIMTGIILAMARGAGEVAPLMLVGVVKLAPELPIDGFFPYIHLERSFMHLGFHIFDVGFQSRNSEAGKPMVFVTTMLLIGLIASMNMAAIIIRNRLKRKFVGSQF